MARHLVKCLYCGKTFDANLEEYVKPRANRYAHKACAEGQDQKEQEKEELQQYIKELFSITAITPKIRNQIKSYSEKGYSYTSMKKTLQYFFEVRGNSLEKANGGIGIIPWVWDEAMQYWKDIEESKEKNKDTKMEEFVLPVREVHIKPPERSPLRYIKKLFTFLDEEVDL